jgi:hypothetical protein
MTLRFSARRRFAPTLRAQTGLSPLTIGFWLGGGLLGTGGCILGVCMPYHHPVAVAISALWWGIYLGCLGASVGALIGWLTGRAPPRLSATWDGAGMVPTESEQDPRAADAESTTVCASGSHQPRSLETGGSSCEWS